MLSSRYTITPSLDQNEVQEEEGLEATDYSINETLTEDSEGGRTIAAIKDSLTLRRKNIQQHCLSHKQINSNCLKLPPIVRIDTKDVIKNLPSDWVVNKKKSKIIHQLLIKKEADHEATLDTMREKMANLNSTVEDEIRLLGDVYKKNFETFLININEILSNLRSAFHNEECLKQEHFDKAIEELMITYKSESEKVDVLINKLKLRENQRIEEFKTFLQVAYLRLNEICYKTPFEIQEFFVQEIQDVNEITLSNLRSYQSLYLKLNLNVENEVRMRLQEVEMIKLNWVNYIKLKAFAALNEENLFEENFEATKSKYRLDPRLIDLLRRTNLPDLDLGELHDWINKVQIIVQQIDWCAKDIIRSFRTAIQTIFKSYFADLKEIAEKILKLGVVGNNPKTEDVFTPEIYCPSIAEMGQKFKMMLQKLQAMWDAISSGLHKELQLTFMFLNTFANLWEAHVLRMNEAQSLIVKDVRKCTDNSYLDLSNEEANINVTLDVLRQEPCEENLNQSIAIFKKSLDNINQMYNTNYEKESKVMEDKLFKLVTVEGELHKAELINFLSVNESFRGNEEEEEVENEEFDRITVMQSELDLYENEFLDLKAWRSRLYSTIEEYLNYCDEECNKAARLWIEQEREKFNLRKNISQNIIHKSRYNRLQPILYNVRLAELKQHAQRLESHKAGITKQFEEFSPFFNTYQENYDKLVDEFADRSKGIQQKSSEAKDCPQISSQIIVYNMLTEKCTTNLKELDESFHAKCKDKIGIIYKSNFNYVSSMKTFENFGNFHPDEVKAAATALNKLEKGFKKKLKGVFKKSGGKLHKCLTKINSIQAATNKILEKYRIELEYYDLTVNTHKNIHSDIGREAYLLKCHRKSLFGLIDDVKEKSEPFVKDATRIHEFRRLIRVMLKEIASLRKKFMRASQQDDGKFIHLNPPICSQQVFDYDPVQDEETFLGKNQFLIQNSFKTVQEASKTFYEQNDPTNFITKNKILPSYNDFITTNLPTYVYYYIQSEMFWFEELQLFISKLNETSLFINVICKRLLEEYKNKMTKEIKEIHRLFMKRLGEVNFKQSDIFNCIHKKLLVLHGNPKNQNLLDELDEEMNGFFDEWRNIFLPSLEFCTCDLKDMQKTFKSTLEEYASLATEAYTQFNEEINLNQLQDEYLKGEEFLRNFAKETIKLEEDLDSKSSVTPKICINLNKFRDKVKKKYQFEEESSSITSFTKSSDYEFVDDLIDIGNAVNAYEVERLYILLALQNGDSENAERLERWKMQWMNEIEKVKQIYSVKYDLSQNSQDE